MEQLINANPLLCPKYLKSIRIIAFIEDEQLVKKNLESAEGGLEFAYIPNRTPKNQELDGFSILIINIKRAGMIKMVKPVEIASPPRTTLPSPR